MHSNKILPFWSLAVISTLFLSAHSQANTSNNNTPSLTLLLFAEANGACATNAGCQTSHYCAKTTGDCEGSGECTEKPPICPDIWDPVCGCDNATYANSCEAAKAGVPVSYMRECTITPVACADNADCRASQYCAKITGDCEGSGECTEKPLVCPEVWDPVCGCNLTTYGNSCEAGLASMNILAAGDCQ